MSAPDIPNLIGYARHDGLYDCVFESDRIPRGSTYEHVIIPIEDGEHPTQNQTRLSHCAPKMMIVRVRK